MNSLRFIALPTQTVSALQNGRADANHQPPERRISDGDGVPCRHCLTDVAEGEPYLILAYRPFPEPQPYAEVGPIFLHAEPCRRYAETAEMPPMLARRDRFIIRGYNEQDRIIYGTGQVVDVQDLIEAAAGLLEQPEVRYLHVRSATNNCYQCRIESA
jgi:hypothetical protein